MYPNKGVSHWEKYFVTVTTTENLSVKWHRKSFIAEKSAGSVNISIQWLTMTCSLVCIRISRPQKKRVQIVIFIEPYEKGQNSALVSVTLIVPMSQCLETWQVPSISLPSWSCGAHCSLLFRIPSKFKYSQLQIINPVLHFDVRTLHLCMLGR